MGNIPLFRSAGSTGRNCSPSSHGRHKRNVFRVIVTDIVLDVFDNRADPDCIDAKLVQVIQFLRDILEIAALVMLRSLFDS